jgi:HAD superfamily hydrolase (TIGR01509 family)
MDEKGLGKRLQAIRLEAGLTQQALCEKANLSYSTLAKIERGAIKSPSIFTIESISEALGTTLDYLIGKTSTNTVKSSRQRSKNGVTFVYFDINGCLVRFYHRAFAVLAEKSGKSPDVVETLFWHYNDKICRGEMTIDEFNQVLAEHLNMSSVSWADYYIQTAEPVPKMKELVTSVSERYGVGLLSNIMPGLINLMLEKDIIPNVAYDAIIDSSVVHTIKPERKIYDLATKKAGCPESEILLVDDSRANLMAATRLNWHALWFDDYRSDESISRVRKALEVGDKDEPATESQPGLKPALT